MNFPEHILKMKKGGAILHDISKRVGKLVVPGATGQDLENAFDRAIKQEKVLSAFKGYEGYKYHLCVGVNDMVVHGFPSNKQFIEGDLVTVDMGIIYQGYYLDMTRCYIVGKDIHGHQQFYDVCVRGLNEAIKQAKVGNRVGDIGAAAQQIIEIENNYSIVREMVGHGVGLDLHEDPDIPGYGIPGTGPKLKEFQTIAIEIIAIKDPDPRIEFLPDGWQTVSRSGAVTFIMENTVYVGKDGGVSLTSS
jgi:methionyl aminopeptidase